METSMNGFDVGLGLEGTHVVITGAAGQIGQVIVTAFLAAGAFVSGFDINESRMALVHDRLAWQVVDVTSETVLEAAFDQAEKRFDGISVAACVAAAGLDLSFIPHHESICDLPLEQWQTTLMVNTTGTFLTARAWLKNVRRRNRRHHHDGAVAGSKNVSFVMIGSEAGVWGVPGNADYATSKAAIQYGLLRSLAPEAHRICEGARVNAVAPGPVRTPQFDLECAQDAAAEFKESQATVALRRAVPMEAVARACLMLVSENYSTSVTGQVIQVDGGKSGRLLWERDGQPGW